MKMEQNVNSRSVVSAMLIRELSKLGYTKQKKLSMHKISGNDYSYALNILLDGSENVQFNIIYGVYIKKVENFLKGSSYGEFLKGQFSLGFPTIFQELEYYNDKNISNFILPISYERFDETCEYIKSTIELAEKCLSTYEKVKEYVARRFYFPVGHHAFRIPVLLSGPEWDDVRARYIDFVRDTGMVRSYDTFVEEVLPAARELKISR